MLYVRSEKGPRDVSVTTTRIISAISLIAYPCGALVNALGPDTLPSKLLGYGLIFAALISYAPLIGTSLQRIVGEEVKLLDEYELRLRGRALGACYTGFAMLTLLLVLYAAIASDKGFWLPTTYDHFNGVFWGIFLYASVLPTALLSWIVEPTFTGE